MASPIVSFRCPQELKDEIEATATANGLKPSEWLLGLVKRELARENTGIKPSNKAARKEEPTPLADDSTPVRQVLDSELDEKIEQAITSRLESFQRNIAYTLEQYADKFEAYVEALESKQAFYSTTPAMDKTDLDPSPADNNLTTNTPKTGKMPQLNQSDLARRLGCSPSTLSNRRDRPDFPQWSKSKDPEGIGWHYRKWWFYPSVKKSQKDYRE